MAFILGNQVVLDDTESGHLSKLQINGTDVLTLDGSTITLKNVDIADSIEGSINSDNVAEGSTNRFFTAARETVLTTADSTATTDRALIRTEFATADTGITTALQSYADTAEADAISTAAATAASLDTTQTAANKLVWEAYADSVVTSGTGSLDTDDITEAGNLYYTDARADARAQLKIDALVDSAPGSLDTLNELAAALGDDANHVTTMTNLVSANTTLINNLTHDGFADFVTNEHIDWTSASAGTIDPSNYSNTGDTTYTAGTNVSISVGNVISADDTSKLPLTGGNLTGDTKHVDGVKAWFGTGADLSIYHDGADSYIKDAGIGNLKIHSNETEFNNVAGDVASAKFDSGGAVSLYYSGVIKLATSPNGIDVTGDLTATGDVTAYSDERLKRNIETINKPLDIVNALRGVKFEKDGRHSTGVIAQEVEKVLPEVVHTDAEGMKSVAYGNVVGVLIEAIKEQQKQIDWLTAFWQSDAERDSFNKD